MHTTAGFIVLLCVDACVRARDVVVTARSYAKGQIKAQVWALEARRVPRVLEGVVAAFGVCFGLEVLAPGALTIDFCLQ